MELAPLGEGVLNVLLDLVESHLGDDTLRKIALELDQRHTCTPSGTRRETRGKT